MFLVLTASSGVTDELAREICARVQGRTPNRLSANAVEIAFTGDIPNGLAIKGVDVNFIPAENRRKKLLIADMDSTMISVECIDELADFAGVKPEVEAITERAMAGELDFDDSMRERVGLLAGLPESVLQKCYDERIFLNPGARTLVQTMNKMGATTALVSGGFTYFTAKVAKDAGFQINQANTLLIENAKLTGKVAEPILGQQAKLVSLSKFCVDLGISAAEAVAVGDGANDRAMVEGAGLGVAYCAKPALANIADACLFHSDLTALLSLQGIPESEFA